MAFAIQREIMLNCAVVMGRLVADPELRTTTTGKSVSTFTIAVERSFAKPGEQRQADFINIVAWRQTAEFVTKYFTKGSMIGIEGSIQTRRYTDKEGKNRTAFEVVANNVQFVESKRDGGTPAAGEAPVGFSNASANEFVEIGGADDDLPF